ncbi:hypothetical protein EXE43_09595 [Halorubrum sp. SS5]|nr:hypothetical protein EXE43_09595 [Halorubrum sp. SS5]
MAGAKGVKIAALDLPDSADPGDLVTARVDATNTSNFIGPWDPDRCNSGNAGLLVEGVVVGPNGEEHVGDSVCAPQHDIITSYEVTSEVTFEVPERDGTHRYSAYIRTVETQKESSRLSESIDVYGNGSDAPETPGGDGDLSGPDSPLWGGGIGGGSDGEGPSQVQIALGLVLVIALLYSAGQLATFNVGGGAAA